VPVWTRYASTTDDSPVSSVNLVTTKTTTTKTTMMMMMIQRMIKIEVILSTDLYGADHRNKSFAKEYN